MAKVFSYKKNQAGHLLFAIISLERRLNVFESISENLKSDTFPVFGEHTKARFHTERARRFLLPIRVLFKKRLVLKSCNLDSEVLFVKFATKACLSA